MNGIFKGGGGGRRGVFSNDALRLLARSGLIGNRCSKMLSHRVKFSDVDVVLMARNGDITPKGST